MNYTRFSLDERYFISGMHAKEAGEGLSSLRNDGL